MAILISPHPAHQQSYNDVHGWYRARIEQLFARLWHWGLVRNIWRGGPYELHQSVRILLHFTQFLLSQAGASPPLWTMDHGSMSRLMLGGLLHERGNLGLQSG